MPEPTRETFDESPGPTGIRYPLVLLATLFGSGCFTLSWWHWWTFQYGTFDLAFYVQSLWLALHGQWNVSLLELPLMGNHAEPIVFLLTPLFGLIPHPMLLVAVQALALSTMPFTAWRIVRKLGLGGWPASALAGATLLTPAAGFVAIHEFHPEAFAAPLLLLVAEARMAGRFGRFWFWFVLCMACKENIAVLLAVWGVVAAWNERKNGARRQWTWNLGPALAAAVWVGWYAGIVSPHLNGGKVDYGNLYSHLGVSGSDIVRKFFTEPGLVLGALGNSLGPGSRFPANLLWSMILSFGFLPLFRPRWILVAAPLLLQHLLSSRPSEWTIYYHYAAPLVPIFWLASAEAVSAHRLKSILAFLPVSICLLLQFVIGPFRELGPDFESLNATLWKREWEAAFVERLASDPSLRICAGLPYLSHLANREGLHSLHLVLKGLNTLASSRYEPAYEADAVLIDYADGGTFSLPARYYHPEGRQGAESLPSSDELLNSFLSRHRWTAESLDAMSLFRKGDPPPLRGTPETGFKIDRSSQLLRCELVPGIESSEFRVEMDWKFTAPRQRIPWLVLVLRNGASQYSVLVGMCSPEIAEGAASDRRRLRLPPNVPAGKYQVTALFVDQIEALWRPETNSVLFSTSLGELTCGRS